MVGVSAVLAVRDEAAQLPGCLRRLAFADEIVVVVDDRTTDDSVAIAEAAGARVISYTFRDFASLKNAGLDEVRSEWALVVDADERIGTPLAIEIRQALPETADAFRIPRVNYFYGSEMKWGGWKESQVRLVRPTQAHYVGELHETFTFSSRSPVIRDLLSPIHHFTHRSMIDNLNKSAVFGEVDAQARVSNNSRTVTSVGLYYTVLREFFYRLVVKQGWRDGVRGTIECLYQPLSLLATTARLWELQQVPSIEELYAGLEEEIE